MYMEAFRHTLKYTYLKGKVNKRIDKCFYMLLNFASNKGFECLMVKLEKGKLTGWIKAIFDRHHTSNKLSLEAVTKTGESTWQVKSSGGTHEYT